MSLSASTIMYRLSIVVLLLMLRKVMRLSSRRTIAGQIIAEITPYVCARYAHHTVQRAPATPFLSRDSNQLLVSTPLKRIVTVLVIVGFGWVQSGCRSLSPVAIADPPAKVPTATLLLD